MNTLIQNQLLTKLLPLDARLAAGENQPSAKPSKKSEDVAPAGPFRQRRQAFEVQLDKEKPLNRVSSQ